MSDRTFDVNGTQMAFHETLDVIAKVVYRFNIEETAIAKRLLRKLKLRDWRAARNTIKNLQSRNSELTSELYRLRREVEELKQCPPATGEVHFDGEGGWTISPSSN